MAKRKFTTFSLSFLDIMSCGFGAVVLVFLIIKHDVNTQIEQKDQSLTSEVNLLAEDIQQGQKQLVQVKNTVAQVDQQLAITEGLAKRINDQIDAIRNKVTQLNKAADDQQILALEQQLKSLQAKKQLLEQQQEKANSARRFAGVGQRQYLTGLKLAGARTLILLDVSASMLDNSIVNIIRRKNMSDNSKRLADKWVRAQRIVEWLIAKFPLQSQYQIHIFNTQTQPLLPSTQGQWLSVNNKAQLEQVVQAMQQQIPNNGTSLVNAFASINQLRPLPDNIILLTDGLPTQGSAKPKFNKVTSAQREQLFEQSLTMLPQGIPVNILLMPMEGDPMAASAFWRLAQATRGSFMSPSSDWP